MSEAQITAVESTHQTHSSSRDYQAAIDGVRALIRLMGDDPDREGVRATPRRVVKAFQELTTNGDDPDSVLSVVFNNNHSARNAVIVGPVDFVSICEHHLFPFHGRAWIGYVPQSEKIVGLSKLPRTVRHFAARPQVQERLTSQIASAIENKLKPRGVAVLLKAEHACMTLRGAQVTDAKMTTYDLRGDFREQPLRGEFYSNVTAT